VLSAESEILYSALSTQHSALSTAPSALGKELWQSG
jgi:hypothetical protein